MPARAGKLGSVSPPHTPRNRLVPASALTVLMGLAYACANSSPLPPSDGRLALGTWGGDNAGVIVTDSAAHVHIGCTLGDMPGTIELDENGRFTVDGSYILRAYPIQIGPPLPAQFSGRVVGRTLTLAIAVNDTVEKKVVALGPVTLLYGRTPEMGPCPICRVPGRAQNVAVTPPSTRRPITDPP